MGMMARARNANVRFGLAQQHAPAVASFDEADSARDDDAKGEAGELLPSLNVERNDISVRLLAMSACPQRRVRDFGR